MQLRLVYGTQLAAGLDSREETVEAPEGTTLPDLFAMLIEKHGEGLRRFLLTEDGEPQSSLLVAVNDEHVPSNSPRPLSDDDEVILMTPMAGGATACP